MNKVNLRLSFTPDRDNISVKSPSPDTDSSTAKPLIGNLCPEVREHCRRERHLEDRHHLDFVFGAVADHHGRCPEPRGGPLVAGK